METLLMTNPQVDRRHAVRTPVPLQIRFPQGQAAVSSDLSPGGFQCAVAHELAPGTPLTIQCTFTDRCYLTLAGQVVYCRRHEPGTFCIGVKWCDLQEWEAKILTSVIAELGQHHTLQTRSWFTIHLAEDHLAREAKALGTSHDATAGSKRGKRRRVLTPHPAWVIAMEDRLAPYRQAVWGSKLITETSSGRLPLRQVRGWVIQFYPFIEAFPQFMGAYLAKAPDQASRTYLIDNLKVEKRHAEQWIDMAEGFGVSRAELYQSPILPAVEALTHWMWSIVLRGCFVEAVAAANYAIEGVTQGIATIMVKGFPTYQQTFGVALTKKAYYWMEAHSAYDDLHPLEALELIKTHATTPQLQVRAEHAAQRSLEYLALSLDACYTAYCIDHQLPTETSPIPL